MPWTTGKVENFTKATHLPVELFHGVLVEDNLGVEFGAFEMVGSLRACRYDCFFLAILVHCVTLILVVYLHWKIIVRTNFAIRHRFTQRLLYTS